MVVELAVESCGGDACCGKMVVVESRGWQLLSGNDGGGGSDGHRNRVEIEVVGL